MTLNESISEYQLYMPRALVEVNYGMVYITIMKYPINYFTLTKELGVNTVQDTLEYTVRDFIKFMEGI
jgi:hypothetical protein